MRRVPTFATAVALLLVLAIARPGIARADEGWVITSFNIVYDLQTDGTIQATETINADFGSLSKHGIFRYFNTSVPCGEPISGAQQPIYPCPTGQYRKYDYSIKSVTKADGSKWKYDVSNEQGKVIVKIGDGDIFITGAQDYIIKYTVKGALDAYDDHDELYWDASGEWPVTIEAFTLTVDLPEGADARAVCYEGYAGSNEQCGAQASGSTITYAAPRALSETEQVTIVAGWQRGLVEVAPPVLADRANFRDFFTLDALEFGGIIASGVLGVLAVLASWWRYGRDKAYLTVHYLTSETAQQTKPIRGGPPIVVEFLPPEGLHPAQMGVLMDERADTLDVTATIVDLAVRGYLHITELPKKGWFGSNDWKLTKLKDDTDLTPFERRVLAGLFNSKTEVEMSDLRYKFADDLAKSKELLYDDAVKQKWFEVRPESARGMWVVAALAMMIFGVGLSCFAALYLHRGLFFLGLVPAGLFLMLMSRSMARRTAHGSEILRRVLGFRLYIETAEKYRQQFNEQENIFARYLPFAIVFGSVGKWAKAFEGLEATAAASTAAWYSGTHPFQPTTFSRDLQGFSSSVGSTLSSTRSSSGGSGFSGGSSGGGGGGGGGGSW
ncbi:DUF2207 domain-containing protein [Candidatus Amarobacter glycogenicus]|uniref:DUF2207 domain-containing protein n=1 Tax=Candidatus Amarobacter glycogenicus TaxID=3140699 RepID=UPI00313511CC|nr:DUF2207 domain-containing protein [Dehalococcoidia bacterium]